MKAIEPVAGPSKSLRAKSKEGSKGGKKAKSNREVEEVRWVEEQEAMRCRCIATWIMEKKVEIEMLWKEIEGLEEMLED